MGSFRCEECSSKNVQVKVWVDPNRDTVIDMDWDHEHECWCEDCGENKWVEYRDEPKNLQEEAEEDLVILEKDLGDTLAKLNEIMR